MSFQIESAGERFLRFLTALRVVDRHDFYNPVEAGYPVIDELRPCVRLSVNRLYDVIIAADTHSYYTKPSY